MATTTHPHPLQSMRREWTTSASFAWAAPVGRFFFSLIFILSGFRHFSSELISYAASAGVPMAQVFVPVSGVLAIVGGLSVLLGYHARMGALLLLLFLVPVTFSMHAFWTISDPQQSQMQMAHFMKNLSLIGASFFIFFMGSGPFSIEKKPQK